MVYSKRKSILTKDFVRPSRQAGIMMETTSSNIVEQLIQEFSAIEGIELEPSDHLLLRSFVEELGAAGGISTLENFLDASPTQTGAIFHYWLDYLYDVYGKFFTDFRDFKALRHTCITALLQKKTDKVLTIWCVEPGSGQEAYSLSLMLNRAIPELNDWTIRLHTSNQRRYRFQRCKGARFNTIELSQGLPDSMVQHLIEADFEDNGFLVKDNISRHIQHHHTPVLMKPNEIPLCDIILLRGVYKYLGKAQAEELLKILHTKLNDCGYLMLSRHDEPILNKGFRRMNTVHGSALYIKNSQPQNPPLEDDTVPRTSTYTVHDLSTDNYKQMVKHLKQLKLLEGISVGEHDKFMLQFPIRKFSKGDKILHEGDPNTNIYGIVDGHLSIWVGTGLLRRPEQLTSLGVGQIVGEGSSLNRTLCSASVIAEDDVTVFEISDTLFKKHYGHNASFASRINAMMNRRARERGEFKSNQKSIKASNAERTREGIGLVNEGRYVLDEYSLPDGMKLTPITPDLMKCFKEFSRETSLFRALPLAAVETVANLLCAVEVKADTTIIKEGSWPVGFYLICKGEADIYKGGGFLRIGQKITQVSTGAFIGETSVILGQKATASVISRSPMTLCVLSRELFEYIYNSDQSFALEIDRLCAERR